MDLIIISIIFSVVLLVELIFIIMLINLFKEFISLANDMHIVMNQQFEQIKNLLGGQNGNNNNENK